MPDEKKMSAAEYKAIGVERQQSFYENLGDRDWDQFDRNIDLKILETKVAFALFEMPSKIEETASEIDDVLKEETASELDDVLKAYTKKQQEHISSVYNVILTNAKADRFINLRIVFAYWYSVKDQQFGCSPLFILETCIVDYTGRVYNSWEHFKKTNVFPKCELICPEGGKYSGQLTKDQKVDSVPRVKIECFKSAKCRVGNQILSGMDKGATVISLGTLPVAIAGLIPAVTVAPVLLMGTLVAGAGVGVYCIGRSIASLVDRDKHRQSISPEDPQARACWLSICVGSFAIAAPAASLGLAKSVQAGVEVGKVARGAVNSVNALNVAGSAASAVNSSYGLYTSYRDNGELSTLEVLQVVTSVVFFFNSACTFRTAQTIVQETQASTLDAYRSQLRSNRHRKLFNKALKESQRLKGTETGNADIIAGVRRIDDPDNFFAGIARLNRQLNMEGARYTITRDGSMHINDHFSADPAAFASQSAGARAEVLSQLPKPDLMTPNVKWGPAGPTTSSTGPTVSSTNDLGKSTLGLTADLAGSAIALELARIAVNAALKRLSSAACKQVTLLSVKLVKEGIDHDLPAILKMVTERAISVLVELCVTVLDGFEQYLEEFREGKICTTPLLFLVKFLRRYLAEVQAGRSFEDALLAMSEDGMQLVRDKVPRMIINKFKAHFYDSLEM